MFALERSSWMQEMSRYPREEGIVNVDKELIVKDLAEIQESDIFENLFDHYHEWDKDTKNHGQKKK
jgi:hypothetical protein